MLLLLRNNELKREKSIKLISSWNDEWLELVFSLKLWYQISYEESLPVISLFVTGYMLHDC